MLTPTQREEFEQRLRNAFDAAGSGRADELLGLLGDPPDVRQVPDSFWSTLGAGLSVEIQPIVVEMAVRSALALAEAQGLTAVVDWNLVNGRAGRWAARYTFELVKGINANSQRRLGELVDGYFRTAAQDLRALGSEIAKLFGPARGRVIATTEVTRAASQGERALVAEIRAANPDVQVVEIWLTSNDELVCPICGPLHGKRLGVGWTEPPPAHPNCRCVTATEIVGLEAFRA